MNRYVETIQTVCLTVSFLLLLTAGRVLQADDGTSDTTASAVAPPPFQLAEVVIEGTLIADTPKNVPRSVTVYSELDIDQSSGGKVADLIGRSPGVTVSGFSGQDKLSGVDIRGMGATAGSNVLIIVDGVRLNAADISGADFSSISLGDIEQIEIIRGGSSVVYGDGAVGGVVRLTSRRGEGEPVLSAAGLVGSYQTREVTAGYRGKSDRLGFNLQAVDYSTDGYRDNGYYRKRGGGIRLGWDLTDRIEVSLTTQHHTDAYGLPGPVNRADADSVERRRKTDRPDDDGETVDGRLIGRVTVDFTDRSKLTVSRGYRIRHNEFVLGYNPLLTRSDQLNRIDEDSRHLDLKYTLQYGNGVRPHVFRCGLDHYVSAYVRESTAQRERKNSRVESLGLFLMNRWAATERFSLELGTRQSRFKGVFREDRQRSVSGLDRWQNGDLWQRDWSNQAVEAGLIYRLGTENRLFLNYATSFRSPRVDEFVLADRDLSPQQGRHFEIGTRLFGRDGAEAGLTLFQTLIENEIYYGTVPGSGETVNRNYESLTRRTGLETTVRWFPSDHWYLWVGHTWMAAVFEGRDTVVPLVPAQKLDLGAELTWRENLVFSLTGQWVGEQFDGNDETNDRYQTIPAYPVLDTKATWETADGRRFFAGVNNLLDERYITIAYSESTYPMPMRNLYAGIKWRF